MCKTSKTKKINNRLRKVEKDTLIKLYKGLSLKCASCVHNANCPEMDKVDDTCDCVNFKKSIELNELIRLLKEYNVNLDTFSEKYGLKKEFLMEMLHGRLLIPYKYYVAICKRCYVKEYDEFQKYIDKFREEK